MLGSTLQRNFQICSETFGQAKLSPMGVTVEFHPAAGCSLHCRATLSPWELVKKRCALKCASGGRRSIPKPPFPFCHTPHLCKVLKLPSRHTRPRRQYPVFGSLFGACQTAQSFMVLNNHHVICSQFCGLGIGAHLGWVVWLCMRLPGICYKAVFR